MVPKHTITTEHNLRPFRQWKRGTETGALCANLLCKTCAFAVVAMVAAYILYLVHVHLVLAEGKLDDFRLLLIYVMILLVIGMGMLLLGCSVCSGSFALLRKWRAHNSDLVVQEVTRV